MPRLRLRVQEGPITATAPPERLAGKARLRRTKLPVDPATPVGCEDESEPDTLDEIRRVAIEHAPPDGYGETWWNEAEHAVFWAAADWSTSAEIDAARDAFLAIPAVETVEVEAEALAPDSFERVWPIPGSDEAYARVLALATRPLDF